MSKNIAIDEETHRKLKTKAAEIKKPLGEAATEACEDWIRQHDDTKKEQQQEPSQEPEREN